MLVWIYKYKSSDWERQKNLLVEGLRICLTVKLFNCVTVKSLKRELPGSQAPINE